ncbi:MAG: energy-coupling factor transporter transmembrane protein EcfT [Clostridia bacterium]|nr:energy-coupling factor transporter transmembrane protein EcfT [Clostridia bacterium]
MLPEWMRKTDDYVPPKDGGTFVVKTIQTIGKVMSRLKVQAGHEKKRHLPALFKLLALVALIVITSITQSRLVLMGIVAGLLAYLCTWPAKGLLGIFKTPVAAAALAFVLFLPAMLMNPAGIPNNLVVVAKVFICVTMVTIFNHTTQWNHVTLALRKIHVPGIFVFTLDITLKYIVLLGNLIQDLLTSMQFRAVGKHEKKYSSIGGVMGVTFIRGTEMNEQMYEAMRCRGFTDDYKGL